MTSPFILAATEIMFYLGGVSLLVKQLTKEYYHSKIDMHLLSEQLFQIGTRSLPLVLVTALSTGMVMSLQFGIGLEKFGGGPYVPKIVSLSILREMGPVFTSIMIAARVGAGIASEIGSMVVTQQIDAIRALGTSPIQKIVIPRVLACLIALPLLAAMANIIGICGAGIIGVTELNLNLEFFFQTVMSSLKMKDFFAGFGKTIFFSLFISLSACYFGLNVKEGAKEVGIATTKTVVYSCILILVGDFFLTKLFWMVEQWI